MASSVLFTDKKPIEEKRSDNSLTEKKPTNKKPTNKKSADKTLLQYRIEVALRIVFAVLDGYALTTLATVFLSYSLPLSKSDAVVTASVLSFTLFMCAITTFYENVLIK